MVQFSSVQSLSDVQLFATLWTVARKACLSITNSWSLPKLMAIESVMPSNHLILCCPLLFPPSIFPSIRIFSNESVRHIRWLQHFTLKDLMFCGDGINGFELWCWRRLLRVPWTARKPNPSILKEISPEYSLEVLMLKLQYFGHLKKLNHLKRPWCWERLKVGREGDDRGWDGWMVLLTQWTWVWASSGSWWWTGKSGVLQSMEWQRVGHDRATELKLSHSNKHWLCFLYQYSVCCKINHMFRPFWMLRS